MPWYSTRKDPPVVPADQCSNCGHEKLVLPDTDYPVSELQTPAIDYSKSGLYATYIHKDDPILGKTYMVKEEHSLGKSKQRDLSKTNRKLKESTKFGMSKSHKDFGKSRKSDKGKSMKEVKCSTKRRDDEFNVCSKFEDNTFSQTRRQDNQHNSQTRRQDNQHNSKLLITERERAFSARREELFKTESKTEAHEDSKFGPIRCGSISSISSSSMSGLPTVYRPDYYLYLGKNAPLYPGRDIYGEGVDHRGRDAAMDPRLDRHQRIKGGTPNHSREKLVTHSRSSVKDNMTGCHQFLRYATTLFTFILFLAGAGILGLGVYIIGSDYGAKQVSEILGNDLYQIAAYVLIASGSAIIMFSMCGCCGAIRESKCMLAFFIFFLSIFVIALLAAASMVFVFREKMSGDIIHSMKDVLTEKYGVDMDNSENRMITDFWNWLQSELHCCGVNGDANSTSSWSIYKHSQWYKGFESGKPYVPQSCCKAGGDLNICTGITPLAGGPAPPVGQSYTQNPHLYTNGCYDELVHYIQSHAIIIGVAAIATVIVMLFGLFFSVYLCRRIDMDNYYSAY